MPLLMWPTFTSAFSAMLGVSAANVTRPYLKAPMSDAWRSTRHNNNNNNNNNNNDNNNNESWFYLTESYLLK